MRLHGSASPGSMLSPGGAQRAAQTGRAERTRCLCSSLGSCADLFGVQGAGFKVQGLGLEVLGSRYEVCVWSVGFKVSGADPTRGSALLPSTFSPGGKLAFRVQSLGCRVEGLFWGGSGFGD